MTTIISVDHASRQLKWMLILASVVVATPARAEGYPFEGTWVRADRVCSATAPSLRTYAPKELTTPAGRCILRKVASGSGEWELFEDCRRTDRSGNQIERIRMLGADAMLIKRQSGRLKIPRGRRYVRCTPSAKPPAGAPAAGKPAARAPGERDAPE